MIEDIKKIKQCILFVSGFDMDKSKLKVETTKSIKDGDITSNALRLVSDKKHLLEYLPKFLPKYIEMEEKNGFLNFRLDKYRINEILVNMMSNFKNI